MNENMGHLVVYLRKEEVTKQFSFICWLYCFICSIGTSIPYLIFLLRCVIDFLITVGSQKNKLHIHKETVHNVRRLLVSHFPLEKTHGREIFSGLLM